MSSPTASTGDTNAEARITQRRAGTALAVVGAVLLGIGVFTSTGATVQPLCPTGTKLVAKFTWTGSKYRFDEPSGNSKVVTISSASATGGRFDATRPIASVLVKGGPGSKDSWITPAATSGTFTNADLPSSGGRTPNIDTVQFCVATAVNPSTAAAGFDVVTKGDAVLAANESEGPVAIGGNVRFDQYQVAVHSAGTFKVAASDTRPTALLVKGKAEMSRSRGQLTVEDGWIAIGTPKGVTAKRTNPNQIVVNATSARIDALPRILGQSSAQSLPSATRSSSFDFNGAFTTWKSLAEGLARCDATVKLAGANGPTAPFEGGDGYIYGTDQPGPSRPAAPSGQMVLKLKATDLSRLTSITFRYGAQPSASRPLVIDVSGVPAGWNPPTVNGDANEFAPYILWNFGSATKVVITGANALVGTAFAPAGTLDQEGAGNLVGAVYATSFIHNGTGEVHDRPFATTVTPCSCTPPPTTTSTVYPTSSTTPSTSSTVYPTSSSTTSSTTPSSTTSSTTSSSTTSSTVYPTSSSTPSSTTSSTTTSSSTTSTTTTSTTTTSTTTPSSTTSSTTPSSTTSSSTSSTTSSTTPGSTTSSTVSPTSSTTLPTESTTTAEVEGTTVVATSITPDDNTRVESSTASKGSGLAFTGSTSLPLVILGALLLLAGVTAVLVDRRRSRSAGIFHGDG